MELIQSYFGDFSETQESQFRQLGPLYQEWNQRINVISRKDIGMLYVKHVLHSLAIAAVMQFQDGTRIVDLGTGGGFPGIPLAILMPQVHFHMVDSIGKKIKVVAAVAEALHLQNVSWSHQRAETLPAQSCDFVVSRAVAPLKDLVRWSRPLVRKGARQGNRNGLICLKGGDLSEEISESGTRPMVFDIHSFFREPEFGEKYVVYVGF